MDDAGELVEHTAAPPDAEGLRHLAERPRSDRVRAAIESMTGARFVHDTLEEIPLARSGQKHGLRPRRHHTARSGTAALAPGSAASSGSDLALTA